MSITFDKQAAAAFMHSAVLTYAQALNALSDAIWETPETAFEEYQSAQAIAAAQMPNAHCLTLSNIRSLPAKI